jgi:translation initiation factor 3 subunit M
VSDIRKKKTKNMGVHTFMDLEANEQIVELRKQMKLKGADISEENTESTLEGNLAQVITASDVLLKEEPNDIFLESTLNSIVALVMVLPYNTSETLTQDFCSRLGRIQPGDKRNIIRLRLLSNLFNGLDESSPIRYVVYSALVKMAGQSDLLHIVNPKLDEIRGWITKWGVSVDKVQALLRSLHEALLECKQSERATKVMLELLGTYTEETASEARADAHRCIVTCLADPNTLLFDHLLALKPVKFLEGEPIHNLLTIFVTGKLPQYVEFAKANKDFITSIGLNEEQNMHKMRVLTFMQLAETKTEISFETMQNELQIEADDVEPFIIDVVRTKSVHVRLDQIARRVLVCGTAHRTFGKQQWQLLRDQLNSWQRSLGQIMGNLQTVTPPR